VLIRVRVHHRSDRAMVQRMSEINQADGFCVPDELAESSR
jgi:hypothetical protein